MNTTSTSVFGATSTTDNVLSGVNLRGKRILVTGVSAGLGVETARSLAAHGARVVGAARDLTKAEAATTQVRKDGVANGGNHSSGSGNFGVGPHSCVRRRNRRPVLRELPRRQCRSGRRDDHGGQRRCAPICTRSRQCRGSLEEK